MSVEQQGPDDTAEEVEPVCNSTSQKNGWETKEAAVYPPGYPRLCEVCFEMVPEGAWNGDGTADYDHTNVVDQFVRAQNYRTTDKVMHRRQP